MRSSTETLLLMLTAFLLALALQGCAQDVETTPTPRNTVIAASKTACSGASPLLARSEAQAAVESGGYIDVITVDGDPGSTVGGGYRFESDKKNSKNRDAEQDRYLATVLDAISASSAQAPEVDLAKVFEYANASLAGAGEGTNVLVIAHSGISTTGLIDLTQEGMLSVDPDAFIAYLEANGLIPKFEHIDEVVWYGFGTVADGQPSMPLNVENNLKALYTAYLKAAGVDEIVFMDNASASEADHAGLPGVTQVPMPTSPAFTGAGTTVKFDQAVLAFQGDSAEFIDEDAAREVLDEQAEALAANPQLKATVRGYTASYPSDPSWPETLSEERAEHVKQELIELGASEDQITAVGCGVGPNADLDADGRQIEPEASNNRMVTITYE